MTEPQKGRRAAVFLDRDGTIIVERDYLADPAQVRLEAGAADGLRRMAALGLPLIVLTNQSGIARGYFTRADADAVNARVAALLDAEGVRIAGWFVCPHGPADDCDCRKPAPGLALRASETHAVDPTRSFMIGDKEADMGLARAIGATGILVTTGHGRDAIAAERSLGTVICASLNAAAEIVEAAVPR